MYKSAIVMHILMLGLTASTSLASPNACVDAFMEPVSAKSNLSSRQSLLLQLHQRIKGIFEAAPRSPRRQSDREDSEVFFRNLESKGAPLDLKIADVYLSIRELINDEPLYHEFSGSYADRLLVKRRQVAKFQEQHWSWRGLSEYMFDSPSILSFVKQDDLNYLQHVFKTARSMKAGNSILYFGDLLGFANESWVDVRLQSTPDVQSDFLRYRNGASVQKIWARFAKKFYFWTFEPSERAERKSRDSLATRTISALRTSNMSFDTYILEQYFDLIRTFKIESPKMAGKNDSTEAVANWNSFEGALAQGSIDFATDFLFQNSHDVEIKAHLSRILSEMNRIISENPSAFDGASRRGAENFEIAYKEAKKRVEARLTPIEAPENYRTDLQIFTSQYRPADRGQKLRLDRIVVRWNPVIGKLQTNVTTVQKRWGRVQKVSDVPELRNYICEYFENFRRTGAYSEAETAHDENAELEASLTNTTFMTFTKPGTSEIVGMIRIFDGNGGQPTYIEREFPQVQLLERSQNTPVYELGRLMSTADVAGASMPILLSRVAEYFVNTNTNGFVYLDGTRAASTYYRRAGAQIAFEPKDLNLKPEATPIWILKISIDDLVKRFTREKFESLRLKENTSPVAEPLSQSPRPWWRPKFLSPHAG